MRKVMTVLGILLMVYSLDMYKVFPSEFRPVTTTTTTALRHVCNQTFGFGGMGKINFEPQTGQVGDPVNVEIIFRTTMWYDDRYGRHPLCVPIPYCIALSIDNNEKVYNTIGAGGRACCWLFL